MPNWVTNIVEFSGDEKLIAKMKKEIKDENNAIDFNKIAPIPKELEGTRSPMVAISKKEYKEQERRIASGELTEHEKNWGISRCLTQELIDEYNEKFGACEWYHWQLENWGTKWNACDSEDYGDRFEFNTAWSNPFALLVNLSKKYPKIEFNVRYADEDFGHNVGEYTLFGGLLMNENVPKGGSREALELAMTIQYGDISEYPFDDYETFTDLYSDELNEYLNAMIEIAYENGVTPFEDCGYHIIALDRFKELALEDENYELVALIQKELEKVDEEK